MVDKKTDVPNQDGLCYEVLLKAVEYHRVISKMQKRMYNKAVFDLKKERGEIASPP